MMFCVVLLYGCDLDVSNPNSPTDEDLSTYDGIKLSCVGMQARLSQSIGDLVTVSGAVSGETCPIIMYLDYQPLRRFADKTRRTSLDKSNSYVRLVWTNEYKIIKTANDILKASNSVSMADETKRGVVALAETGKAIAFYTLLTHWEKIAINTDVEYPSFVDRTTAIDEALKLLNDAEKNVTAGALSAEFSKNVLQSDFKLLSTIRAFKAKFYLMKGDYASAITSASNVTEESQYTFTVGISNPLYTHFTSSNFSASLVNWFDNSEKGDKRVKAMVDTATSKRGTGGGDKTYAIIMYNAKDKPFKIYTLNEMTLIKAEAMARSNGDAVSEINKVRVAAGLASYSGQTDKASLLAEIAKQRYYELYVTAQFWEDLRRFKNDGITFINNMRDTQLAHEWLTYPDYEIDKNPNCPAQQTQINYGLK